MKKLILTDQTSYQITDKQADNLFTITSSNNPPKYFQLGDNMIKLDSISRIEPSNKQDDIQRIDFSQPIFDKLEPKTDLQEKWLKVIRANSKLLKAGLLPKYTIINGKTVEKEYYWR